MNVSGDNAQLLAILAGLFGIGSAIFWMVVGWRAMRAHERIAEAAERANRKFQESHAGEKPAAY